MEDSLRPSVARPRPTAAPKPSKSLAIVCTCVRLNASSRRCPGTGTDAFVSSPPPLAPDPSCAKWSGGARAAVETLALRCRNAAQERDVSTAARCLFLQRGLQLLETLARRVHFYRSSSSVASFHMSVSSDPSLTMPALTHDFLQSVSGGPGRRLWRRPRRPRSQRPQAPGRLPAYACMLALVP